MHNQFKTQKFKHLMLAMGPRDLNSAPYSPVHCSSHSMTSCQSSELTELPVVENGQLFAQRVHSARYTPHGTILPGRVGGTVMQCCVPPGAVRCGGAPCKAAWWQPANGQKYKMQSPMAVGRGRRWAVPVNRLPRKTHHVAGLRHRSCVVLCAAVHVALCLLPVCCVLCTAAATRRAPQGCIGRGRGAAPPPLQGAQPTPSHCLPDGKCQAQWHLKLTVTAPNRLATSSDR